jgi:ribosomal protein S21
MRGVVRDNDVNGALRVLKKKMQRREKTESDQEAPQDAP